MHVYGRYNVRLCAHFFFHEKIYVPFVSLTFIGALCYRAASVAIDVVTSRGVTDKKKIIITTF